MSLSERDADSVWHPYTQAKIEGPPLAIKSAKDTLLHSKDGKTYIDAISSWWVNLHGHGNAQISNAINKTAGTLDQIIFAGLTHEPAVKLAENLLSLTKEKGKVFYSDDGSTAVEAAIKMAIQYSWNKGKKAKTIIALKGAYHGDTFGAMSVSSRGVYNKPFEEFLFDVQFADVPLKETLDESLQQFENLISNNSIFAFIFEPLVQGAAGMKMYSAEGLDAMLLLCKEYGVLSIADEVFTGFGRTGKNLACDYLQNKPDIICLSKGITGGVLPLGATIASNEIYEAFLDESRQKMLLHGHSYTANPISCAAANASFELLLSKETQTAIVVISESHKSFVKDLEAHNKAENVRLLGTILAFEVKSPEGDSYLNSLRDKLYNFYLDNGVLLRPLGNTVYIVPPYCIKSDELKVVYNVILKSLDEVI